MPTDFVVPGATRVSAALDLARTVVRRAERLAVTEPVEGSLVGRYLNRLSDLLWAMARWTEGDVHLLARGDGRRGSGRRRVGGDREAGSDREVGDEGEQS
jgi:cob(I)alamin adenosyltransferase